MEYEFISNTELLGLCFAFLALGLAVGYFQGRRDRAHEIETDQNVIVFEKGRSEDDIEKAMIKELKRFAE